MSAHHADSSPPLLIWIWVFSRRRHRIVKHKERSLETEAVRSKIRLILDLIPSPTQMQSPFNILRNCSYRKPPFPIRHSCGGRKPSLLKAHPPAEPGPLPRGCGAAHPEALEGSSGARSCVVNPSWLSSDSDTTSLPLGNDISAMLQSNMADISIKQAGWVGLNLFREVGRAPKKVTPPP